MTYFEIHRLHREGLSVRHLNMSEQEYEAFLIQQSDRKKILLPYEDFVRRRLEKFQDNSAAQMHDWLKEHFDDLPAVSQKTVFNRVGRFVCRVRDKHLIPVTSTEREYQVVDELPYGKQAQTVRRAVDFGEYNMRNPFGTRAKVLISIFGALLLTAYNWSKINIYGWQAPSKSLQAKETKKRIYPKSSH